MTEKEMDALPLKLLRWFCLLLGYGFLLRAVFGSVFAATLQGDLRNAVAALISLSSIAMALALKPIRSV